MGIEIGNYTLEGCVGRGTFGDVYKAINKADNLPVAIKAINIDETTEDVKTIIQEIQVLSRLRSEYITKYLETFVNGTSMWIVMEYCGGGSCADLLKYHKKLSEQITAVIIKDVLKGLDYLHSQKKVHRDIKLANILLTEQGQVKLADFGVSGEITFTHLKRNTFVGTPFWMAPEVISRENTGYNEKADIWSTGITTIELVTGSPPLSDKKPIKALFEIPIRSSPTLEGLDYSDNIKDFVKYCLIKKPKKRPNANMLLCHKFITSIKRLKSSCIIPYILAKDQWIKDNKITKTPRNAINLSDDNTTQEFQWNFDSTRKVSPMQQTLVEYQKYFTNTKPIAQEQDVIVENPWDEYFAKIAENQQHLIDAPAEKSSTVIAPDSSNITDYQSLFILCLQRVKERGQSSTTKSAIDNLIEVFKAFELNQPGLCETLFEEISRFKYLAD